VIRRDTKRYRTSGCRQKFHRTIRRAWGGLHNRSKTKALALRTQERRRTYCSFRNETHSTVSFPTPGRCANSLPSGN